MMHWLVFWRCACLATLILGFSRELAAQEICGLQEAHFDTIFFDGFNPVPAGGGLGPALTTVSPPTLGQTPSITITLPTTGAALPGGRVQVMGTVSGPVNTGVTVNGVRAWVYEGIFLTPSITLGESTASLEATATTMDGLTANSSLPVDATAPASSAKLIVSAEAGYAPLPVNFHLTVASSNPVQHVSMDFDGDGNPDYQGSAPGEVGTFTYTQPGVHSATATITLANAQQLTASHRVIALDFDSRRSTICSVYALFRAGLNSQNASAAGYALTDAYLTRMAVLFDALSPSELPGIGQGLGTLADGVIALDYADIIAVRETGTKLYGYPVHFVRDANGVWRIASM